jgi:long-chain acyl-CoA synthetase
VPNVDVVKCWALENNIPGTLSILCANLEVKKLILNDMLYWGKDAGLKSFEQVGTMIKIILFLFNFYKN